MTKSRAFRHILEVFFKSDFVFDGRFVFSAVNQTAITSKDKRQGFGPFADVYEEAYGPEEGLEGGGQGASRSEEGDPTTTHPPPTFLVPLLHPHFFGEDGEGISSR